MFVVFFVCLVFGGWRLEVWGWRLGVRGLVFRGWRSKAGGWRLEFMGWRLEVRGSRLQICSWRLRNGRFCPTPLQTNFYYAVFGYHWVYLCSCNSTCRLSKLCHYFSWCFAYFEIISESLNVLIAMPIALIWPFGANICKFWNASYLYLMCCSFRTISDT